MGAYLSHPITEKHSIDESNETYACGASSMQGWRMTQEDAHNCILNFDTNASLFTVFDGHGGAEVALYCAAELPRYLKVHDEYKKGNYDAALREAFIGFDGTLVNKAVIEELKKLIQTEKVEGESETEEDDENLAELHEESCMPISEVLEKYKDGKAIPILTKLKAGEASGSKPISPFLRGRRNGCGSEEADGAGSADDPSSSGGCSASSRRKLERDTEDEAVSSSSTLDKLKTDTRNTDKQANDAPDSSSAKLALERTTDISASSSSTSMTEALSPTTTTITKTTNGDDSTASSKPFQENEISTNSAKAESVSSSSAVMAPEATENGSVSKISTSKAKPRTSKVQRNPNMPMMNIDGDSSSDDDEDDSYEEEKSSSTDEGDGDDLAVPNSDDSGDSVEGEDDEEEDSEDEDMYPDDDDEESFLNNMIEGPGLSSGCTAVVALVVDRELYVANAGDSRCVVCRDGKALDMSVDHKPEDKVELDRIKNAGGKVTVDGRVNGGLNLSRAIGDHAYKMNKDLKAEEQMISALPDIKNITITSADEFMVIACDGIWNYMTSEEVVDFVKQRLDKGQTKISSICEELFTNCLAPNTSGDGTGCDNMTAVIVKFKHSIHDQPAEATSDGNGVSAQKRSASPVHDEAEAEACHKRFKTGDTIAEAAAVAETTD